MPQTHTPQPQTNTAHKADNAHYALIGINLLKNKRTPKRASFHIFTHPSPITLLSATRGS